MHWLYDEQQRVPMGGRNYTMVDRVTIPEMLDKCGYTVDKRTPQVMRQAGSALRRLGWAVAGRADVKVSPTRAREYERPKELPMQLRALASGSESSTRPPQGDQPEGADDGCPF
jgi:hypothetical protein